MFKFMSSNSVSNKVDRKKESNVFPPFTVWTGKPNIRWRETPPYKIIPASKWKCSERIRMSPFCNSQWINVSNHQASRAANSRKRATAGPNVPPDGRTHDWQSLAKGLNLNGWSLKIQLPNARNTGKGGLYPTAWLCGFPVELHDCVVFQPMGISTGQAVQIL